MRKPRFTEQQIITVIKSVETGRTVRDVCREAGIAEATYYNWKSKYGAGAACESKNLQQLKDENRRLWQKFTDLSYENRALKAALKKSAKTSL